MRSRRARIGLTVLILVYLWTFLSPLVAAWDWSAKDLSAFLEPPGGSHWWGTTQTGEDVYAQSMRGLQRSLSTGLLAGPLATVIAAVVGSLAGYFGGWTDRILMWGTDLLLVVPAFVLVAIASPALNGGSFLWLVLVMAGLVWMITARVVRSMARELRERPFVQAARYTGMGPLSIIYRHVLPNTASILIIDATISMASVVLLESALSYFGFGVQSPDVSLGTLIRDGTRTLAYPWLFLPPSLLLIGAVLVVNYTGDGLRDALDPGSERARRVTGS
ncbi:ABC transporter permease [Pseudonocardiaceae bacterium YIM PH 21723]|nr:ABC transporter permease [Pseudonocardiaceae bacterium YIM PH 21723]